jgi:PAS domain S-box-containing protein
LQNNNFLGATITYKDLNKYMFNGKKLHEYQISERSLPNNSIIINRQSKYLIEEWDDFIADTFFGYDLFENHGGIMLLVEPNSGLIVDANKSAIDYYSYESLIGKNIMEINALSEQEIIKEMEFAKIYEKNYFNFKHILGNGEIRNVEVYSYPIEVKNTNILFSIIIDVTEKMNLQKQLEENLEEHKKAEKFAEFGHWSINLNTNIVDSSYGAKNLYGFDKENLTLKDIQELPLSKYRDELDNALYELINEGKAYDIKFEIQRKDGEILWIHSIAEYNEDENFIFGIIHNITDAMLSEKNLIKRTLIFFSILILLIIILIIIIFSLLLNIKKRKLLQSDLKNKNIELTLSKQKIETTNEELEATNEELETTSKELENNYSILEQANNELKIANEAKASFLARVSHELRTPMNGILGGSYLINNSDDITQIKEYAKLIEESSNRLMPIIDDILNVSKKEEVLINSNDKIDVKKFLEYEIMKFKSITEKKYLKFIFKNKIENNIFVKSDKTKITHILNRIIKNAITYTEKGKIEITCETQDIENNKLNLKIAVKDTGIGIKKEFYEKIFEPFEQGEEYLTRKHQGLGLGLSITKDLIEKMGGNINFKSEEAKGTTFYFNLILEKIIEPNKSVISNKTDNKIIGNKIKILAAEDDEIGIALLKNFFKKQSYDLDVAINGEKAVDLYKNKKYDIILMDIQMPILDGIETARIIRSIENKLKKHTPIIALTGHANETDKENCLNAGMDDFLIKPYEFEDLLYAINKYVLKE